MYKRLNTDENRYAIKDGLDYVFKKGDYKFLTKEESKKLHEDRLKKWKAYFNERYK